MLQDKQFQNPSSPIPVSPDLALRRLEGSDVSFGGNLEYPTGVGDSDKGLGHFIHFTIYETIGTRLESNSRQIDTKLFDAQNVTIPGPIPFTYKSNIPNFMSIIPDVFSGIQDAWKYTVDVVTEKTDLRGSVSKSSDSITLYMPEKITTAYRVEWEQESMRSATFLRDALRLMRTPGDRAGPIVGEMMRDLTIEPITRSIDSLFNVVGINLNSQAVINSTTRTIANPFIQMLFKNVNNRSFEFSFQFTPRSQKEADVVYNIIKVFKRHALPSRTAGGRYLNYPSEFEIAFYCRPDQQNMYLHRIKRCVLTDINVDYMASNSAAFYDSVPGKGAPPVHSILTLSFTEISPLTSEDVEAGY